MLQTTKELYGHPLIVIDGQIGQVKDFYFDDKTWVIHYLVADTGSPTRGRNRPLVFGPGNPNSDPESRTDSYEDLTAFVKLSKAILQNTAEYNVVAAPER